MTAPGTGSRRGGFTLVELIVVVAIAAIILTLAAPSFRDYFLRQRLKGIHAQLVTDLAFARSHAAATGAVSRMIFGSSGDCYTIYTARPNVVNPQGVACDCSKGAGNACPGEAVEARTVQTQGLGVWFAVVDIEDWNIGFDPVDGGMYWTPPTWSGSGCPSSPSTPRSTTRLALRTTVGPSGRSTVCARSDGLGASRC
ncbi:MAG: prepilin-type N-terminal cleavage/methylation domain-containing protein [Comamonadaceae bacterium]|nr:prepilin-type N-terminal cleavage/methylation domain-containing protein [Comamonadaceae bacterium]